MKNFFLVAILILCCGSELRAHDTFLKFANHYLQPQTKAKVLLMNGTFESSENSVALERMQDVRITGPKQFLQRPDAKQWRLTEELNELEFVTNAEGTYIVGVSIKPRIFEMTSKKFDSYLAHDGVLDILEARKAEKSSKPAVKEKYSKHVKALFQVGKKRTRNFGQVYNYPIEIVPQNNPFLLNAGDTLPVKVLFQGQPVKNQLVYASYVGFHQHGDDGQHVEACKTRTNSNGVAEIKIAKKGRWYVRLIHMVPSKEKGVDYESNWATLTFEVKGPERPSNLKTKK